MHLLVTIAFLLSVAGCFIILDMTLFAFLGEIEKKLQPKKITMKRRIKESRQQKQPRGLRKLFTEVREILRLTGKSAMFSLLCILSMVLFVIGVLISLSLQNFYMVPVMAAGMALLPFYYVKFTASRYKRQVNMELETALSIITTSYLRNKNTFMRAVEENIEYLNPPVSEVFRDFLMQSKFISSNTKEALEGLKAGIDNAVFHEWVDGVIACQDDYNLKSTLSAIVAKLSDMRIVSAELDLLIYEPIKEYITMIILLVGSIPILYFLNKSWYETLLFTGFGKLLLAVCAFVLFASVIGVSKHTRPIEYKR